MSKVDLILLGLVYENPRSAYDLQKHIEYRNLSKWVRISIPSVYKNVRKLEDKGYLTSKSSKETNMPEKNVYTITEPGKEYFTHLMKKIASDKVNVFFEFNSVIANLNKIPTNEAIPLIDNIKENIMESKDYMSIMIGQRQEIPLVGRTIMEQQLKVLESLEEWIQSFEKEFKEKGSEKTKELTE